ncbi:hypothetical protein MMC11_003817 [Xylographa trunciseda]|nr:hypothetical protein [Xylographa trunciseda]
MVFFLLVLYLFSISYLVIAQIAAPSDVVDTATSDLGIFQLVTPTTHANQVPVTALASLSSDAIDFYNSYIQIDAFDYISAQVRAVETLPYSAEVILEADEVKLDIIYGDAATSLLNNPTSYLSRLQASASPWPSDFSSSLMSQATGILLGYESLVSQDVLSKNSSSGPVTPGMSIAMGPAMTSTPTASSGMGTVAGTATGMTASTSSSKAAGVPVVTASPLLLINAAAAAVGVLGVAMM